MITFRRAWTVATAAALLPAASDLLAQVAKRPMTIDDVMSLKSARAPAISPNGSLVAFQVSGWEHPNAKGDSVKGDTHELRSHVWLVPADGSQPARQITFSERGESGPRFSPDGSALAFVSARGAATGGDAPRSQIHLLRLSGGEAEKLTDAKDGVTSFVWAPDGRSIAFLTNDSMPREEEAKIKRRDDPQMYEGPERRTHLWVIDVPSKQARELVHDSRFTIRAPAWSPDATRLTFTAQSTNLTRDERRAAYIVTVATGALKEIQAPAIIQGTPVWSPDGNTLAFATLAQSHPMHADSMMEREQRNSHLTLYDVATGKARDVYNQQQFDESVGAPIWSADGKKIYFTAGDRAYSSVYTFDVASGSYRKLTNQQMIGGLSFSKDGSRVAMTMDSPMAPTEVYVGDATFASPRKLTALHPELANIALGETEVITWKSSDGQDVEGILVKPVGYQAGKRYPLLVEPHGGPTGATSAGFKASSNSPGQFWAGRGWATLYPNPRGSTNYGEKFMRGNILDWGGGDYRDIMTGVDALIARGIADPDKLAVAGWSYGGYMTAWVISQTQRFKAARMGAGLTDLESMYGTTDIPGYIGAFFDGTPDKKTLDLYRERSAITYRDRITTPTMIMHGSNDARVPIGQPMELFRALKDKGTPVELWFYPREGHGFSEYYHQIDKMNREFEWIAKYTLGAKQPVTP